MATIKLLYFPVTWTGKYSILIVDMDQKYLVHVNYQTTVFSAL